jgi:hypothetical protein
MTTEERIFYESAVGRIELREKIVRRSEVALDRAHWFRNAIGVMAIIFVVLRAAEVTTPFPGIQWIARHDLAIALGLVAGLMLTATNIWCARQRLSESRDSLLAYVSSLPRPRGNPTYS